MQKSEERLMDSWATIEHKIAWSQIEHNGETVDSFDVDDISDLTQDEIDGFMEIKKKTKRDRRTDIDAVIALLTGKEVEVKSPSAFGQTAKEFVMRPHRSTEQHRKIVEKMASRGYAFDPMACGEHCNDNVLDKNNKFTPRELAPVAQAIFGILNSENSYQRHNR